MNLCCVLTFLAVSHIVLLAAHVVEPNGGSEER